MDFREQGRRQGGCVRLPQLSTWEVGRWPGVREGSGDGEKGIELEDF